MLFFFEVIGGFVLFCMLILLSLLLMPGLFGCLTFILFWLVLIGLIVFFSLNIVWFILIIGGIYLISFLINYSRYRQLPSYDSYLASNLNVFANGKALCKKCNSDLVVEKRLLPNILRWHYFMCYNCKTWLYKKDD